MLNALRKRIELLLDVALSQSEDPRERIKALVAELRLKQAEGRQALGLTVALEKKLLDELIAAEDAAAALEAESKAALQRGEDATALGVRLLDARKREGEARQRWQDQRAVADKLRAAFTEASRRTDDVAHAHTILLARAHCAEASRAIADALALVQSPEVRRQLDRVEAKAEQRGG